MVNDQRRAVRYSVLVMSSMVFSSLLPGMGHAITPTPTPVATATPTVPGWSKSVKVLRPTFKLTINDEERMLSDRPVFTADQSTGSISTTAERAYPYPYGSTGNYGPTNLRGIASFYLQLLSGPVLFDSGSQGGYRPAPAPLFVMLRLADPTGLPGERSYYPVGKVESYPSQRPGLALTINRDSNTACTYVDGSFSISKITYTAPGALSQPTAISRASLKGSFVCVHKDKKGLVSFNLEYDGSMCEGDDLQRCQSELNDTDAAMALATQKLVQCEASLSSSEKSLASCKASLTEVAGCTAEKNKLKTDLEACSQARSTLESDLKKVSDKWAGVKTPAEAILRDVKDICDKFLPEVKAYNAVLRALCVRDKAQIDSLDKALKQ